MDKGNEMGEAIIPTMCASHCGGACLLKVHVRDGVITRIETDDSDEPILRACMRGRAYRQRVYANDRILYPMKRTGERGDGKFVRITWDEALNTVKTELKRVRETYGPMSILHLSSGGDLGYLHGAAPFARLLSMAGGYTNRWGKQSFQGGLISAYYTYGTIFDSNNRDDLLNSRLILLWGCNPASSINAPSTNWFLTKAKEQGIRIVAIDPLHSESVATFAEEWVPIRPGTDTAMLIAMAYVIISENLQDQKFLDTYTVGFEKFRAYVLGLEDSVPKTPVWAEAITGVPAGTIERLAREFATLKPAALRAGIAPGRAAFGEQYHRAAVTLAAITGNVGVHGGDPASRAWESIMGGYPYKAGRGSALPQVDNPVERGEAIASWTQRYPRIHFVRIADAILKGKAGGYPSDYKLALIVNSNYLVAEPNTNKVAKAMKALEFIAVLEQFMTPTARYADIILPTTTYMERNDIVTGVGMSYYGAQNKVIEPRGECKSHYEIAKELAARMGINDFDKGSEESHINAAVKMGEIPDYKALQQNGVYHIKLPEPYIAFKRQIEDPKNNPFPTPSGKIEIFSQQIADLHDPLFPPIPKYIPSGEGIGDPLYKKYPIQLLTNHSKRRANAQFDSMPWLRELVPQSITINVADAEARGINNGDMVRVFNDRGEVLIPAQVTQRIMPGVALLPAGAWYDPDGKGVDRSGCANVLTNDEPSPGGSFPYNTVLVEIKKA